MSATPEQVKHLEVRVWGWRYPRHVMVSTDTVAMEIARTHCSHCSTCAGRISRCERALSGKPFERRSAGGGEYFVLPYPVEADRTAGAVASFLGKELRLEVEVC